MDRTAFDPNPRETSLLRVLLLCGLFSSAVYIIADQLASWLYPGYIITDQNYSELLATGAPTRPLMLGVSVIYNLLVAAFAIGIWKSGNKPLNRFTASMILAYAFLSLLTPLFFQMDMRGAAVTARGNLHGPMTAMMSVFIILSITSGGWLRGRSFLLYSLVTLVFLIVFGMLTVSQVPGLAANEPTPWMGLFERVNIYATMLWFSAFSVVMAREAKTPGGSASFTDAARPRLIKT